MCALEKEKKISYVSQAANELNWKEVPLHGFGLVCKC